MGSSARQGIPGGGPPMQGGLPPGWTPQQMQAGGRMQAPPPIPGQQMGIAQNWTLPPPPTQPRQNLAMVMGRNQELFRGGEHGGGYGGGGGIGYGRGYGHGYGGGGTY